MGQYQVSSGASVPCWQRYIWQQEVSIMFAYMEIECIAPYSCFAQVSMTKVLRHFKIIWIKKFGRRVLVCILPSGGLYKVLYGIFFEDNIVKHESIFCTDIIESMTRCRCWTGTLKNPTKCLRLWEADLDLWPKCLKTLAFVITFEPLEMYTSYITCTLKYFLFVIVI